MASITRKVDYTRIKLWRSIQREWPDSISRRMTVSILLIVPPLAEDKPRLFYGLLDLLYVVLEEAAE
jgi:hypothetical protein